MIEILFVNHDGWEYEMELPAIPCVDDEITIFLDEAAAVYGKVISTHWTIRADRYFITVHINATLVEAAEKQL